MKFVNIPPERGSYLIVAPTGSGKTTSILSNIPTYLKNYDRVFLTFPTKALMFEISQKLTANRITHLVDNSDVRITKNVNVAEWFENKVIVCSYEKLDAMLLVFPTLLKNALVVIDEVHLATDSERALSILSILASVKKEPTADAIVMSATIPGYKDLAEYLGAQEIVHKETNDQEIIYHEIPYTPRGTVAYLSALITRIYEIISADPSKPTIVFRAARRHCDVIADQLCKMGIKAAAYHAGVKKDVKDTILKEFMDGRLKVIVATHALCWGVNTPAERVIIAGSLIYKPGEVVIGLKTVDIKQMAGRAGRPGYSNKAEVHLIYCDTGQLRTLDGELMTEKELFERAMNEEYAETIGIKKDPETILMRYLLVQMLRGRTVTVEELLSIARDWYNMPPESRIKEAVGNLISEGIVTVDSGVKLTKVGRIAAEYYISYPLFKTIKQHILDNIDEITDRVKVLEAVGRVARHIRNATMVIPDRALESKAVLAIQDDNAREAIAQFTAVTGDTDPLAEAIKSIAFFVARVLAEDNKDNKDWVILGKTMKQIRLMIYNKVDIKGVIDSYMDGTIDMFFENYLKK